MGEFQVIEQISAKQNQNIQEALTGVLSILNIRQENRAIYSAPEKNRHDTQAKVIFAPSFGWSTEDTFMRSSYGTTSTVWI